MIPASASRHHLCRLGARVSSDDLRIAMCGADLSAGPLHRINPAARNAFSMVAPTAEFALTGIGREGSPAWRVGSAGDVTASGILVEFLRSGVEDAGSWGTTASAIADASVQVRPHSPALRRVEERPTSSI